MQAALYFWVYISNIEYNFKYELSIIESICLNSKVYSLLNIVLIKKHATIEYTSVSKVLRWIMIRIMSG